MPSHVLVAYDGSSQAEAALELALESFPDAHVTLLTAIDPLDAGSRRRITISPFGAQWLEDAREDATATLDDAADRAHEADVDVDVDTAIEVGRPANVIVGYAEEHAVDHVVMGSHGRSGVTRILLGSVAETVIRRSPVPVTVARDQGAVSGDSAENGSTQESTNEVTEEGPA